MIRDYREGTNRESVKQKRKSEENDTKAEGNDYKCNQQMFIAEYHI